MEDMLPKRCKRKCASVSAKSQPMKKKKTALEQTRLKFAVETGNIAAVAKILETKSEKDISVLNACLILVSERGYRRILQLLLKAGADINTKNSNGYTSLMIASQKGFLDIVCSLIKHGADISIKDETGKTAFLLGVEHSCSSGLLSYFLSAETNANVNDQDKNGKTALMLSVDHWNIDTMEMLVRNKRINLDLKDRLGRTAFQLAQNCGLGDVFTLLTECYITNKMNLSPLKVAVKRKDCDLIRLLLDCDYRKINEPDYTPLMAAFVPRNIKEDEKISVNLEIVKMLINSGADVNKKSRGWTTLMCAAKAGNVEGVRLLVENGADVNRQCSFYEKTALMVASEYGHMEVVDFLISQKADVAYANGCGTTALQLALEKCETECARILLKNGAPANEKLFRLAVQNGLHRLFPCVNENLASKDLLNEFFNDAIQTNKHDLVEYLLDNGADVNKTLMIGTPPLVAAVEKSKDMVELLIDKGVRLNDQSEYGGYSALIKAANLDKTDIVKILVTKGVDVTLKSNYRRFTALQEAIQNESLDAMKILLEAGAAVNDQVGDALHTAVEHCKKRTYKVIKLLLDYGADVNYLNNQDETPIIKCKNKSAIQLLLNKGADINAEGRSGNTLLLNTIARNDIDTVKWLIKRGVDINKSNNNSVTPLIQAVTLCTKSVGLAMVKLLVEKGADVNQVENKNSALHRCIEPRGKPGSADIMKFLIDKGADVNVRNDFEETPLIIVASIGRSDLLKSLLDSGADVNAVARRYGSCCALSKTLINLNDHFSNSGAQVKCLEILLEHGAKMNELCLTSDVVLRFHVLITYNKQHLIRSLIKSGVTPDCARTKHLKYLGHNFRFSFSGYDDLYYISPLCTALFSGKLEMASFFLENWYLVESDLYISEDSSVLEFLQNNRLQESLAFLDNCKNWSLAMLAFMSLSHSIGFNRGREERVRALPIPHAMQEKLLYRI